MSETSEVDTYHLAVDSFADPDYSQSFLDTKNCEILRNITVNLQNTMPIKDTSTRFICIFNVYLECVPSYLYKKIFKVTFYTFMLLTKDKDYIKIYLKKFSFLCFFFKTNLTTHGRFLYQALHVGNGSGIWKATA